MKATMNLLRVILFVLLLGAIGCAPEDTEVGTPEEIASPVAEVVIRLLEDGSVLAMTLTNTGDVELTTTSYGFYRGYELILKDALGESLVHLVKEGFRIPGTDEFRPEDWHHFPVGVAPGQSIEAVLPLSAIFPFEPGQEKAAVAATARARWLFPPPAAPP